MSSFNKRLFEALQLTPLTTEDSHLKPVKHGLKQSNQRFRTPPSNIPPEVHSNLKRERVKLSDNIVVDCDVITEEDLPLEAPPKVPVKQQASPAPAPAQQPLPSTTGYTIQQAKGQIDGVIKQWMLLAGNYPTGSAEQDKFIELGKRLGEISRVIERDFVRGGASQAPTAPSPEAPPQGESLEPEGQEGQGQEGSKQPEDEFDI